MVEVPVVASLVTTDSEVVLLVAVGKSIQVSFLSPLQRGGALRSSDDVSDSINHSVHRLGDESLQEESRPSRPDPYTQPRGDQFIQSVSTESPTFVPHYCSDKPAGAAQVFFRAVLRPFALGDFKYIPHFRGQGYLIHCL